MNGIDAEAARDALQQSQGKLRAAITLQSGGFAP